MIFGVGIDTIEIERIAKAVARDGFLEKYFSKKELEYFTDTAHRIQVIAGNFAAKEAFSKSIGTGIRGFSLAEVAVLRDELGKPYIELTGSAEEIADNWYISGFYVSITNTKAYASAVVIAEKD